MPTVLFHREGRIIGATECADLVLALLQTNPNATGAKIVDERPEGDLMTAWRIDVETDELLPSEST